MQQVRPFISVLLLMAVPLAAFAHGDEPHDTGELLTSWSFDPLVVLGLGASAIIYVVGLSRLWSASQTGGGISLWQSAAFASGWLTLVIALVSPVHAWGEVLFSAHMTQHEILMLVSAPLMVLGRPVISALWALPRNWRSRVGEFFTRAAVRRGWRTITHPFVAWGIHAAALWIWHVPLLFQATLDSDVVHTLQHVSFFGSALLFWWAIVSEKRGLANYGAGVLYLFTTSIHSGILGALLTFTQRVWYPIYSGSTATWGLTPLEDQQLGGLIMWVPAGLVYIGAALFMFAGWLRESEVTVARRERISQALSPEA